MTAINRLLLLNTIILFPINIISNHILFNILFKNNKYNSILLKYFILNT